MCLNGPLKNKNFFEVDLHIGQRISILQNVSSLSIGLVYTGREERMVKIGASTTVLPVYCPLTALLKLQIQSDGVVRMLWQKFYPFK